MNLRPYQIEAVDFLTARRRAFLVAPAGSGKCLGFGTPVMLASGEIRAVQDIRPGDLLMGPDGQPRRVRTICAGREELFKVVPVKGDPYVVNRSHILSLVKSSGNHKAWPQGQVFNIPVTQWLELSGHMQKDLKGWRSPSIPTFHRPSEMQHIPPYLLGVWLGDGASLRTTFAVHKPDPEIEDAMRAWASEIGGNFKKAYHKKSCPMLWISTERGRLNPALIARRAAGIGEADAKAYGVPPAYKYGSMEARLQLLAGLLDTDGHLSNTGYDFISKDRRLSEDVTFIARSLGLAAYMHACMKGCQTGAVGEYFRVSISGDTHIIPCRIPRKKAPPRGQIKNVCRTGIHLEPLGVGDYYGFEIEGPDRLFLLGDFTVTHNTVMGASALAQLRPKKFAWIANTKEQVEQAETALAAAGRADGLVCCMMARPNLREHDLIVIDEAAHAPASVWDATIATVREDAVLWGLSATPFGDDEDRNNFLKQKFEDFMFIDRDEVMAGGHLVPGRVVPVDLDKPYEYDVEMKTKLEAECKRWKARYRFLPEHEIRKRVQWQLTLEHLQNNATRNAAVVNIARSEMQAGEVVLILVASIEHGERLAEQIEGAEMLHSKLPAKTRRQRVEDFRSGKLRCAVATSLADEGADIPRASVLLQVAGGRSATKAIQRTGRVMRPHKGKTEGVVYDFVDRGLAHAHAQHKARMRTYRELGYSVETL